MIKTLILLALFAAQVLANTSLEACVFLSASAIIVMLPEPKRGE